MYTTVCDTYLCRESTEEAIPEVHQGEGEVLVEKVVEELAHADVGPPAMDQQEALQVPELGKGEIAGEDSLHPLLPTDSHPNVGSWEHGHRDRQGRQTHRTMETNNRVTLSHAT